MPPAVPRVACVCAACGRTFHRLPSELRRRPARHCSRACRATDPVARFWARVDRGEGDGCWRWTGGADPAACGPFKPGGGASSLAPPRFAYALEHGAIPAGHVVRQRCGDPRCVRPDHLEAAPRVNGFPLRPANAPPPHTRLTRATVAMIRARHAAGGVLQRELAAGYGLSPGSMSCLLRGESWHVAPTGDPAAPPTVTAAHVGDAHLDPRVAATLPRLAAALRVLVAEDGHATRRALAERAGVCYDTVRHHWAAALARAGLVEERRRLARGPGHRAVDVAVAAPPG